MRRRKNYFTTLQFYTLLLCEKGGMDNKAWNADHAADSGKNNSRIENEPTRDTADMRLA